MTIFNRTDKPADGNARPPAPDVAPKPVEPARPQAAAQPLSPPAKTGASMASVISKALKITDSLRAPRTSRSMARSTAMSAVSA